VSKGLFLVPAYPSETRRAAVYLDTHCNIGSKRAFSIFIFDTTIHCRNVCCCFCIGIITGCYDAAFKSRHRLCLSIMKRFGLGSRMMETRILMEVEEMINKVREKKGHPFDVTPLTTSCVANVIMSMLFAHRFDHSDPAFQQLICDIDYMAASYSIALQLFPVLRFFPNFKKLIANTNNAFKRSVNFINNRITACTQVCNRNLIIVFI